MAEPTSAAERIITKLTERGQTLATCESLTGGLVAAALTAVPRSSAVFRGGLITYATDLKLSLAGVAQATADGGVVTEQTAVEMALGARERCRSQWGLATTGVAGPGDQDGVPAGTAWIAVVWPGATTEPQVVTRLLHLRGDRAAVQAGVVEALLAEVDGQLDA